MKIAYVGHSYHRTTGSTAFLLDLLRERGELEIFWDEGWLNRTEFDVTPVVEASFDAVVVCQIETVAPRLRDAGLRNVTFVPMYDGCFFRNDRYWAALADLKILCFSSSLHERLQRLGLRTRFVHYFPDPAPVPRASAHDGLAGFFWQRQQDITWRTIRPLLGNTKFRRFTVHRALDPSYGEFVPPYEEDRERFAIRTTGWFADRREALAELVQHNVYFAPRLREGIGQSFLEAMAMGFLVVAPDHPTMNEYMVSGVNGLLYDPANPVPLDFSTHEEIGARARRTVEQGHAKWRRCRDPVFEFIATPPGELPIWAPLDAFDPRACERGGRAPSSRRSSPKRFGASAATPGGSDPGRTEGGLRLEGRTPAIDGAGPLVTVAVVTRNAAKTLRATLESTLAQDWPSLEVVVIDGASDDGTVDIIREYDGAIDYWRSAADGGPYEAMNAAARAASGRYVLFMNAGDLFQTTDSLTLALDGAPPDADVIFGHHVYRDVSGHDAIHQAADFRETWSCLIKGEVGWRWQRGVPGHQATLTRTELLRRFPYRTSLRIAADHDLLYRLAREGARFHHAAAVLATYFGGGLSWKNQTLCFEEWRRLALEHTAASERAGRIFEQMRLDIELTQLSQLSTRELLRRSARDRRAFKLLRRRVRASIKERLRRCFGRSRNVVVDFGSPDFGGDVQRALGFSGPEPWGRWTDGERAAVELARAVERPARVSLRIHDAFGPNVGKHLVLRLGGLEHRHVLRPGKQVVFVKLGSSVRLPIYRIELEIPAPTSPRVLQQASDDRLLGVALCRLEVEAER